MTNKQDKKPLYDALVHYAKSDALPFDVPGHKMGKGISDTFKQDVGDFIFKMDVNSMKELDSLSNPTGVILEAEKLANELFHADHSFFLVNGSTSGVQNMIVSTVGDKEKIILPRNVHKSAINAIIIAGAIPIYIDPVFDEASGISMGVKTSDVKAAIEKHPDAKALLLLHPTYFGFTSDIESIIELAHANNIAVLVDQSHGSHFGFHPNYPVSAIEKKADLITISMHKTGGSLTQSSILLHNNGLVAFEDVRSTVNLFQTSSASYLLLASLDLARYELAKNGKARLETLYNLSKKAEEGIQSIGGFEIVNDQLLDGDAIYAHDATKLTINVKAFGLTGFKVYDYFKTYYNIQLELGETYVVLAVISLGDDETSVNRLIEAFKDFKANHPVDKKTMKMPSQSIRPHMIYTPREAFFKPAESIPLEDALNRVAADSIMIYPPGIPLVVPGEMFTQSVIETYKFLIQEDNIVIGSNEENNIVYVNVLK